MRGQPFAFFPQRGVRRWETLPAARLSWAEDAGANQLVSRYKGSLNFPPRPVRSCWPQAPRRPPGHWWSSLRATAAEGSGGRAFRVPACLAVSGVRPLPLGGGDGVRQLKGLCCCGRVVGTGLLGSCLSLRRGDQGASWGPFNCFPFSHEMKAPQFLCKLAPQRSFSLLSVVHPSPLPSLGCGSNRTPVGMPQTEGFRGKLAVPWLLLTYGFQYFASLPITLVGLFGFF